jgi:hypothetical protein
VEPGWGGRTHTGGTEEEESWAAAAESEEALECPTGRADADAQLLGDGLPRDAGCPRRHPNSAVMKSLVNSYRAQDRIGLVTGLLIGGLKQQTMKDTSRWFTRSHSQPPFYGAFCPSNRDLGGGL